MGIIRQTRSRWSVTSPYVDFLAETFPHIYCLRSKPLRPRLPRPLARDLPGRDRAAVVDEPLDNRKMNTPFDFFMFQ